MNEVLNMKVTIKKDSFRYLTVNEYEHAKQIVRDMKDDGMTAREYAESAAAAILNSESYRAQADGCREILKADATICRDNATEWDRFGEGCGDLNVWVEAVAETFDGFLKFACLLSDIWNLDGSAEMANALARHAYIRYYTEKKN